jgi:hypothetical protein
LLHAAFVPAIVIKNARIVINFGREEFSFGPPDEFQSLEEAVEQGIAVDPVQSSASSCVTTSIGFTLCVGISSSSSSFCYTDEYIVIDWF